VLVRAVLIAVALLLGAAGMSRVYAVHQLHVLEGRQDDPNPVPAPHLAAIRVSRRTPILFERFVVDSRTFDNGRKPKVIIDPDGRGSVVGAQAGPHGFALYRPGQPAVIISRYSGETGAEDAQTADFAGDGAPDIVVGGLDDQTYLLRNPRHLGCADVYRCLWNRVVIDTRHASHDVVVGDVDHDGKIDIATENGIYFNGGTAGKWHFVGRDLVPRDGEGTSLADLTGDGILDVIAPYRSGTMLARLVNPLHHGGNPRSQAWSVQVIDAHPPFAGNLTSAVADIDGNGRNDLIVAPMYGGGGLVWYENPGNPDASWKRHLIDATVNFVHQGSLRPADFNGNGRPDIAFAEQDQSPTRRVGVVYNLDGGAHWHLQVLSTNGGHNIKVGVIGHDARPSIVSARHGYFGGPNPLVVWRDMLAVVTKPAD
jgi:hypothetical protein